MSDEFKKGGIGSGRKGHHSIGRDYSDESHDSVFEDSEYDNTQEKMIEMDRMKEIMDRNDARTVQRMKEKEQAKAGGHGMSRKTPPKFDTNKMLADYKAKNKPSLWQRLLGKSEDSSIEKAKKKEPMEKNLETLYYLKQLMKKGGPGSGKRGHSTPAPVNYDAHGNYRKEDYPHKEEKPTPVSDTSRQMDPDKKKKILAGDRKSAKKEVKGHSPEELQNKINQHKEMSESKFLSPASRESYAAKHKALVGIQKKNAKSKEITKKPEPQGVARSKPGPFGNISKAEFLQKFLAGAALKTGARVVQNLVKPASSKGGADADKPVGGYDGASVAGGVGGAKPTKTPKIKKSLLDRLQD